MDIFWPISPKSGMKDLSTVSPGYFSNLLQCYHASNINAHYIGFSDVPAIAKIDIWHFFQNDIELLDILRPRWWAIRPDLPLCRVRAQVKGRTCTQRSVSGGSGALGHPFTVSDSCVIVSDMCRDCVTQTEMACDPTKSSLSLYVYLVF